MKSCSLLNNNVLGFWKFQGIFIGSNKGQRRVEVRPVVQTTTKHIWGILFRQHNERRVAGPQGIEIVVVQQVLILTTFL